MHEVNEPWLHPSEGDGSECFDETEEQTQPQALLAAKENRQVNLIRCATALVLLISTGAVAWLVFAYGRYNEQTKFQETFRHHAAKIVDEYERSAIERLTMMRSFVESITAHGIDTEEEWPRVTLPNFERRALTLSQVAGLRSVVLHPVVVRGRDNRLAWEAYARENQYWMGLQPRPLEDENITDTGEPIPSQAGTNDGSNGSGGRQLQEGEAQGGAAGQGQGTGETQGQGGGAGQGQLNGTIDGPIRGGRGRPSEESLVEALLNFTLNGDNSVISQTSIPARIYEIVTLENGTRTVINGQRGGGPFLPAWQMAPVLPIPSLVNLDALSLDSRQVEMASCMEYGAEVVSRVQDYTNTSEGVYRGALLTLNVNRFDGDVEGFDDFGPVSDLYFPVFDSFDLENATTAAVLSTTVFWLDYFVNILPEGTSGIIAVLENTCGQEYSFEIDGFDPHYLGPGDFHDHKYDAMVQQTGFGTFLDGTSEDMEEPLKGNCYYNVRVYPSQKMENTFTTNLPLYVALFMIAVFAFTSLVFLTYDRLSQRRHKVVNKSAVASNAVVSNLFPDAVRDRMTTMYDTELGQSKADAFAGDRNLGAPGEGEVFKSSMPIADLYPHTTVMFADIAGFTKYSSTRSPTEIFQLLEALYGSFDRLARKHKVFKVETIGDCYVAATGLPKPQLAHAEIMCRFATSCLIELGNIMPMLVEKLGADTADLSMRVGLHSGAVTAGVLRGEKARFQLFGDTVNTAARMESNGQSGRIHVSQDTADLLKTAGRGHWITKRDDLIEAKGKGMMQTFWITTGHTGTVSTSPFNESRTEKSDDDHPSSPLSADV